MEEPLLIVSYMPDPEVQPFWPALYDMLLPAARVGRCEVLGPDDLVWVAIDGLTIMGAVTTCLLVTGDAEIRNIAGARCVRWFAPMEAVICNWARDCGCSRIVSRGRRGWAKINRNFGWSVCGSENGLTLYEKVL